MRLFLFTILTAIITFTCASKAFAQNVIIENFISNGCGIVPGSEKNLKTITDTYNDVMVLSCHVDETPGIDPQVIKICTDRRMSYLHRRQYNSMSSPTIMINGRYQTKGQYEKVVSSGAKMARVEDKIYPVSLKLIDGVLTAELPALDSGKDMELWVFAYAHKRSTEIAFPGHPDDDHPHDEFGNHIESYPMTVKEKIDFKNVVTAAKKLGPWEGRNETISMPLKNFKADGFAIIAQEKNIGPIVAVGTLDAATQ